MTKREIELLRRGAFKLLKGKKTVVVICYQWGDTGKGKIVDLLASLWAEIVLRATGTANAGHTIVINGKKYILHLIPSGILHACRGVINIIGKGVAIFPSSLMEELVFLENEGVDYSNLMISLHAKLTLPHHPLLDRIKESSSGAGKIGTTGRGAGPVFTDEVARVGLIMNDLLNKDILYAKIKRSLPDALKILSFYDPAAIKKIMHHEHLESGIYYGGRKKIIDVDAVVEKYSIYGKSFSGIIRDTDKFILSQVGKKRILGEGAQGDLLSVVRGTYPFVTSSDCSAAGWARGAGLPESAIDEVLGIVKAFVMTRVGTGPFPTEIGGGASDSWCNGNANEEKENALYPDVTVNDKDEFLQGIAIRRAGKEFGATTGRSRRVGWLDLPLLRYVTSYSSPDVIFTKLDVLEKCETIKICDEYIYEGPTQRWGEAKLKKGDRLKVAIPRAEFLKHCRPVYKEFEGWLSDISGAKSFDDLPPKFKKIFDFVTRSAKVKPKILSVGPERGQTIFL